MRDAGVADRQAAHGRDDVDVAVVERELLDQGLAPRQVVEVEGDDDVRTAEPGGQGDVVPGQLVDGDLAFLDPHPRRGLLPGVDEGDDVVAEVGVGGVDRRRLPGDLAGADDDGALLPAAEAQADALRDLTAQGDEKGDEHPRGHHPKAREVDLEQIEEGRVEEEAHPRRQDDVADLLPELAAAAVVAQLLEDDDAAGDEEDEDGGPGLVDVRVGEAQEAAQREAGEHGEDVVQRQDQGASRGPAAPARPVDREAWKEGGVLMHGLASRGSQVCVADGAADRAARPVRLQHELALTFTANAGNTILVPGLSTCAMMRVGHSRVCSLMPRKRGARRRNFGLHLRFSGQKVATSHKSG